MGLELPNNVQVSTSSHTYTWKLDTCASTHMASEINSLNILNRATEL